MVHIYGKRMVSINDKENNWYIINCMCCDFFSTECICKEIFILSMATMGVAAENILIHNKVLVILSVVLFIIGIIMLILKDNNAH